MQPPTTEQIAAQLESLARRIAPTIALLITLALLAYQAGYALGTAVHQANDWLAQRWPTRPQQSVTITEAIAETAAVVVVDRVAQQIADALALRAQGLSQRAIAEQLGVSRSTVRRRLAAV